MDKAMNFKFCINILSIDRNKSPLQISGKVAGGVCENSRNFWGHPYIGRIARSSLWQQGFLVKTPLAGKHSADPKSDGTV